MAEPYIYDTEWESIGLYTSRLKVPGGWLVEKVTRWIHGDKHFQQTIATWTVRDPGHDKWIIRKK